MPEEEKECNWSFKVAKKITRKCNTKQKEAKQQRHLKIFNNYYVCIKEDNKTTEPSPGINFDAESETCNITAQTKYATKPLAGRQVESINRSNYTNKQFTHCKY